MPQDMSFADVMLRGIGLPILGIVVAVVIGKLIQKSRGGR